MPEGPEIWILSKAINKFYHNDKTCSYGKRLTVFDDSSKKTGENWWFGLTGKVEITDNNELIKLKTGWICGDVNDFTNYEGESNLGKDWMNCSIEELHEIVDSWIKSKQKLAVLILDQSKIAGIGVTWGSEILFDCGLRPDMKASDQNLCHLVDSMIKIREKIKKIYNNELDNTLCVKEFINDWFSNLYEIREMNIYKKGSGIQVLSRTWWV